MALKQVKNKIIATQKTGKVTKAMEAVSAVKMRKSQERALSGKAYAEAAMRILGRISESKEGKSFFSTPKETGVSAYVVITSDKGLAGSLNSAVLKVVDAALEDKTKEDVRLIVYGRKAYEYYTRAGYIIDRQYLNVSDDVSLEDMREIVAFVQSQYDQGVYKSVSIGYQSFVSTFEQNAVLRELLPLDPETLRTVVTDITPKKGVYSDTAANLSEYVYTIEPGVDEVFTALIPQLLQIMFYHALLENKASEHSARMVAMKNATDKAKEMAKALTLLYNKERQAVITAEVSEITGGIEAMKA